MSQFSTRCSQKTGDVLMPLDPDEVAALDKRAQEVGLGIGWDLHFIVAPNPEYVGLTAAAIDGVDHTSVNQIFVLGPGALSQGSADDVVLNLDRLEKGQRRIILDEDGDPRLL